MTDSSVRCSKSTKTAERQQKEIGKHAEESGIENVVACIYLDQIVLCMYPTIL